MSVIKAQNTPRFTKDAVVLDLGDLGRQAARLRMVAEDKAGQIITEAEKKAKELISGAEQIGFERGQQAGYEQGIEDGRVQGRREALEEAREQLAQLHAAWSDVATQWDAQTKGMAVEARQVVIEFALKLAERLVHRVIEVDPTVVVDQVAGALALVLRPMDVSVRVNPSELSIISEALPQLMAEFDHLEHIHLAEDPQVSPGGCVVSYGQGQIDATIEKQIQRVVDLILPADTDAVTQPAPMLDQMTDPLGDPGLDPGDDPDDYQEDGRG
ncbi:MAG: FliH/SctL family protein [Phycisphaerales bacterium]